MYDYDLDYKEQPSEPMTADDQTATDQAAHQANCEAWEALRHEPMPGDVVTLSVQTDCEIPF